MGLLNGHEVGQVQIQLKREKREERDSLQWRRDDYVADDKIVSKTDLTLRSLLYHLRHGMILTYSRCPTLCTCVKFRSLSWIFSFFASFELF